MRSKHLERALIQLAEEGVAQVLRARLGDVSFVFTGDAEASVWSGITLPDDLAIIQLMQAAPECRLAELRVLPHIDDAENLNLERLAIGAKNANPLHASAARRPCVRLMSQGGARPPN